MKSIDEQNRLRELFGRLSVEVGLSVREGHTDICHVAEELMVPILRETFKLPNIKNLNDSQRFNHPAIDLGDRNAGVCFQITASSDLGKILSTLETFVKHGLFKTYKHVRIFILTTKQRRYPSKRISKIVGKNVKFDVNKDVLDASDLSRLAAGDSRLRSALIRILESELDPTERPFKWPEFENLFAVPPLKMAKVARSSVSKALHDFALFGSGIVVGPPGAGKTFHLQELSRRLRADKRPYVYLPVDRLDATTTAELLAEVRFGGNFEAALRAVKGARTSRGKGVFIIDSLDSARSERAQAFFLRLATTVVRTAGSAWNVIVSVRSYDADRCGDMVRLLSDHRSNAKSTKAEGGPPESARFDFQLLSPNELLEACGADAALLELVNKGTEGFRELLRTPFNLWLLEQLAQEHALRETLSRVSSEIELLELYWQQRVEKGLLAEARTYLLTKVAGRMVERQSLWVQLVDVYSASADAAWQDVMSAGVLTKAGINRGRVVFGHTILFDYAVSRLLIDDDIASFDRFLSTGQPARALFLRPSFQYFFTRLWRYAPERFWALHWHLLADDNPANRLLSRILSTAVIASELTDVKQLAPMLDKVAAKEPVAYRASTWVLQAIQAIRAMRPRPWAQVLDQLSRHCSRETFSELSIAVSMVHERTAADDHETSELCGNAARNILSWVWKQRKADKSFDRMAAVWVLPVVAHTFDLAPRESREVLLPVLTLLDEPDFPIDYLYRLTLHLENIWPPDALFASEVFLAVFEHPVTSEAPTQMGSPVLAMQSNRRQDYEMCHYNLLQSLPAFLNDSSDTAVASVLNSLNQHIYYSHVSNTPLCEILRSFRFKDVDAWCFPDFSHGWKNYTTHAEPVQMAKRVLHHMEKLVEQPGALAKFDLLLKTYIREAKAAYLWAGLLDLGTRHPEQNAQRLYELCLARPLQTEHDTADSLAAFIGAAWPVFTADQHKAIEDSIASLTDPEPKGLGDSGKFFQNLLVRAIPADGLSDRGLAMKMALPGGTVQSPSEAGAFRSYPADFDLDLPLGADQIDWSKPSNENVKELFPTLESFRSNWQNGTPPSEDVERILSVLIAAFALQTTDSDADLGVLDSLWIKTGSCAKTIAKSLRDNRGDAFATCRQVLLGCSAHRLPDASKDADVQFTSPAWSPSPRAEAAQGLPHLARVAAGDNEIIGAIERLVGDRNPAVRFLVTQELRHVASNYPIEFWRISENVSRNETNPVVQQALCHSLSHFVEAKEKQACGVLDTLAQRYLAGQSEGEIPQDFLHLVVWLFLVRNNVWARGITEHLASHPVKFRKTLASTTLMTLQYLVPANVANKKADAQAMCDRAKALVLTFTKAAVDALFTLKPPLDDDSTPIARDLYRAIDHVVSRLYFQSGFFEGTKDEPPVSEKHQRDYWTFVKPMLEKVLEVTKYEHGGLLLASTAHYFMQLLNGVLKFDPNGALHLAAEVAKNASAAAYQFDHLAQKEVVTLVETVLANHLVEPKDEKPLNDLLDLLDVFASAGWPEALKLVWRLDEVFR